ncbi:MAG TPA: flagellar motor switch protein FliG [Candidatus Gastranaerophilaceae bacterium]|nr:flagellar motor switch protein FliG [Candidatus Gastranaerophilaceae bacterium]HPT41342.1 flagellar motor switch protein FliG [Candidatus Gastranaerophilaceae bacterium]
MLPDLQIQSMTPTQKVAALLIVLGPATASEVLKNITDDDLLEQITLDIASLNKVPTEILTGILEEFKAIFQASNYISAGGMDYAKQLLEKAYGGDAAKKILDRLVVLMNSNPFQFFNEADPGQLATSFQNENPQLIALIMAYLKPEHSAQVLNYLPPEVQAQVAMKIADMDTTNPEILSEIEKIVESKFSSVVVQDFSKAGGVEALANILNRADRATERNVIELLEVQSPQLAEEVRELMFVFEDIVNLEDRAIQRILREVDTKDLAMSLKGTKEDVKEKVFKNMSERAQQMLRDEMEYMGPVRAREVQEIQTKIVGVIRTLEVAGEIIIARENVEDELID